MFNIKFYPVGFFFHNKITIEYFFEHSGIVKYVQLDTLGM